MTTERTIIVPVSILVTISVAVGLYFSAVIIAPIAGALFIIAIVWPIQSRLQRHLPQLAALAIVVTLTVAVFAVFGSIVAWGFGRIGRSLLADAPRFQMLYDQAANWLEIHGIAVTGLWAEHFDMRWLVRALQGVSSRLNTMVSFWAVVLVYVLLGLLEIGPVTRRISAALDGGTARVLIKGGSLTAAKLRRYMLIRTIMSITTGGMVYALATTLGLQLAAEWGVIAFTLNFIPFVGPFIATVLPTLYALAQFESLQSAFVVFAGLNLIQFVIGSYVEPRVAGKALAISPFFVLFSVFLWSFLWGLFGAFIGVPIAIAGLTFCAQSRSARWLAVLLGASDNDGPEALSAKAGATDM
jgi:predicted PurR-regulated permease PerM